MAPPRQAGTDSPISISRPKPSAQTAWRAFAGLKKNKKKRAPALAVIRKKTLENKIAALKTSQKAISDGRRG